VREVAENESLRLLLVCAACSRLNERAPKCGDVRFCTCSRGVGGAPRKTNDEKLSAAAPLRLCIDWKVCSGGST
jgi:hypothetical protein